MNKKRFLLVMHQDGGCDYTIGCGTKVKTILAESKEDAIASVIKLRNNWKECIKNEYDIFDVMNMYHYVVEDSDAMCSEITLYEISDKTDLIPLIKETVKDVEQYQEELVKEAKEKDEFKKYQELKSKFEANK